MSDDWLPGTMIPQQFLPNLGMVSVRYNQMDNTISHLIWHMAGLDQNTGTAITASVMSLNTRLEMLRRLIFLTVKDTSERAKLEVARSETINLSAQRNRFIHDTPYYWSPSDGEVGFVRQDALTSPQLKRQPFAKMSIKTLNKLANEMPMVCTFFHQYLTNNLRWKDDADFPWPDKYQIQFQKLNQDADSGSLSPPDQQGS